MILTTRGKEVQFWVHLDTPERPGPEPMGPGPLSEYASSSGRPPLPPQAHAHAVLLKAASSFKEKSPAIYRNLSANGTRLYDSISSPPPPEIDGQQSPPPGKPQNPTTSPANPGSSPPPAGPAPVTLPNPANPPFSPTPLPPPPPAPLLRGLASSLKRGGAAKPPPPPPPLPPRTRRQAAPAAALKVQRFCSCSGTSAPKEAADTWDRVFFEGANADVAVYTDDGSRVDVHSMVLMASSPVFKSLLQEQIGSPRGAVINLTGVPFHAARCFLRFVYCSRYEKVDMEECGLHLVVLAHAYAVPALKRVCTDSYEQGLLNSDNVVDVLQVARLFDAPRLHLLCLRRIVSDFKAVARSDGWRAMKESDPALEQELVEAVIEADTRKQDRVRKLEEDTVYEQLHDAMDALVHICRDGCRSIGPHDKALDGRPGACAYPACKGLESLVRHFAACKLKVSGGCVHCKRMWQLLELHSRMCAVGDACKVPLCRHFKERVGQQPSRKEEMRWKMLVQKVKSAKLASSAFSLAAVTARLAQVT